MTLQQHFHYAGGGAKVAVDLEGWVRVEEIGVNPAAFHVNSLAFLHQAQHHVDHFRGVDAI